MIDKVGVDIDNVLADLNTPLNKFFAEKHNLNIDVRKLKEFKLEKCKEIPKKAFNDMQKNFAKGKIYKDALPTPYAEHAINKLRNEGFEIHLVTSRMHNEVPLIAETVRWLDEYNLYYDELHFEHSVDKYIIVKKHNMRAFIEDRYDNLEIIINKCGPLPLGSYIVDYPYNRGPENDNMVRVTDVAQAVDRIVEYRKWRDYLLVKCVGNIPKFVKEYLDGKESTL